MVRMAPRELNIHRNKKTFIDFLCDSAHVEIEGYIDNLDIQKVNDMFHKGPIYLMTEAEANEYLALKHEKEVREAETKEEENNEEHN